MCPEDTDGGSGDIDGDLEDTDGGSEDTDIGSDDTDGEHSWSSMSIAISYNWTIASI